MNDNALCNSWIIKTFAEYPGAHYSGLDIHSVLDNSGISVCPLDGDPAASRGVSKLRGYQPATSCGNYFLQSLESAFAVLRFYGHG